MGIHQVSTSEHRSVLSVAETSIIKRDINVVGRDCSREEDYLQQTLCSFHLLLRLAFAFPEISIKCWWPDAVSRLPLRSAPVTIPFFFFFSALIWGKALLVCVCAIGEVGID
jgi:hypothetical protein